jgi:hypothetical protein
MKSRCHSGALEPEVESTDACKEGREFHGCRSPIWLCEHIKNRTGVKEKGSL